nr:putative serine/threonine-protein kinase-like protein ccr3 [Quercus suber]
MLGTQIQSSNFAFTNKENHTTNNVIQLATHSTSMAAELESVSSVLNGTNPIPANNSDTDANGASSLSISLLFPPAMSEIETDDSYSESNETPRAAAQFSYSISSCFPPSRSETDSSSEIYELVPTYPSISASPRRITNFKKILKLKSSNSSKSNRTPLKLCHSKRNSILSSFSTAKSLTCSSKRPRHTILTRRFKDLEIIDRENFPLKMLLEATNNFLEDCKIETGHFAPVYHPILDDGREVAIKCADNDNEFLSELQASSRLSHKNVARLLGFCKDSNERVFVYEHMEYGTLHGHLHNHESTSLMSWAARIKVALDIARGIEYLHVYAVPPITP